MPQEMERLERYRPLVDDWAALTESAARPLPPCIWGNPLRIDRAGFERRYAEDGLPFERLPWHPFAYRLLPGERPGTRLEYLAGLYHVQEEVSMLPVLLLDPRPGERVLDLCAAPGNKTAQIAAAMENRGTVVANDISALRSRAIKGTLDRLGLLNACTTLEDAANYDANSAPFDRVLADVPCSCEGTSRRHPDVLTRDNPVQPGTLAGRQAAILRKAVQLCRPGGRIVYSTCTFAPEENEGVVDEVLRESARHGLHLLPAHVPGFAADPGLTSWNGRRFDPSLRLAMRVWPHQNDTGGFFVAVLQKGEADDPGPVEHLARRGCSGESNQLGPEEQRHWLAPLQERFGYSEDYFDAFAFRRPNGKAITILSRDLHPPETPAPETAGLTFLRTNLRYPKLTTAAAMAFGRDATRNRIGLSDEEAAAYVARRPIRLDGEQRASASGTGYVLLHHRDAVLGLGLLDGETGFAKSLFPKAWTQEL